MSEYTLFQIDRGRLIYKATPQLVEGKKKI